MMHYFSLVLCLLLAALSADIARAENSGHQEKNCRTHDMNMECDGGPDWCKNRDGDCKTGMRGRCGKRRGDWYGARQPVADGAEAHTRLSHYYTGQGLTVSAVTEIKWGFSAEVRDKDGKVIDRVMIDKRSGRIRSLN